MVDIPEKRKAIVAVVSAAMASERANARKEIIPWLVKAGVVEEERLKYKRLDNKRQRHVQDVQKVRCICLEHALC